MPGFFLTQKAKDDLKMIGHYIYIQFGTNTETMLNILVI